MKKIIYVVLGFLFVGLGIIGIFLPVMPTTIFLIIASYFFMKSSPELNEKLINNKYLGPYIRNYKENKGMPLKSKVITISLLWASILISIFLVEYLAVRILLFLIATGVTIYIISIKGIKTQTE